jgi:hypothetical protein
MHELPPSNFERVLPLFAPLRYHRPAVFTVIEGRQPGRIFVDRPDDPAAVVLVSDFCYFAGSPAALDPQADVLDLLAREAFPGQRRQLLFPFTAAWQPVLEDATAAAAAATAAAYETHWYQRDTFDFDYPRHRELQSGWQQRIPPGFSLHPLSPTTALEVGGIPELWGSVTNFLANGIGACLLDDAQSAFAASAQTVFVGDRRAETGVGTRDPYRRRGLATAACCAYIDGCLESGLQPEWGCVLNPPSEQLAARLGFGNKRSWPFLYVKIPQ